MPVGAAVLAKVADRRKVRYLLSSFCTPNSSRAIPRPRPAPAALRSKTRRSLHLRVTRSPSGLNTTLEKYTERLSLDIPRTRLFCSRLQLRKTSFFSVRKRRWRRPILRSQTNNHQTAARPPVPHCSRRR